MHPKGDVRSLEDALADDHDDFYASQPKVRFTGCSRGYMGELEGPQFARQAGSNQNAASRNNPLSFTGSLFGFKGFQDKVPLKWEWPHTDREMYELVADISEDDTPELDFDYLTEDDLLFEE